MSRTTLIAHRTPKQSKPLLAMPRELWDATTAPDIVTIPPRTILALEGTGAPESDAFAGSIAAMYGIAYTLKFARKKALQPDFKIGPLEARWWTDDRARRLPDVPRGAWRWELRIGVPDDVTATDVTQAIETATHRKGGKLAENPFATRVARRVLPPARSGRVLHVGPYGDEGASFARITAVVQASGLLSANAHSEIYLNDPRRTKPEKLKTVLLLELTDGSKEAL